MMRFYLGGAAIGAIYGLAANILPAIGNGPEMMADGIGATIAYALFGAFIGGIYFGLRSRRR